MNTIRSLMAGALMGLGVDAAFTLGGAMQTACAYGPRCCISMIRLSGLRDVRDVKKYRTLRDLQERDLVASDGSLAEQAYSPQVHDFLLAEQALKELRVDYLSNLSQIATRGFNQAFPLMAIGMLGSSFIMRRRRRYDEVNPCDYSN